jgi:MtN3 and saliva related transmembrane protein
MVTSHDALGLAAGTLTTVAFVPQVVRIIRLRHADDLSWWMFGIFAAGVALWLWYGIRLDALPVILANVVTLALAVTILLLKWHFGRGADTKRAPPAYRAKHETGKD